MTDEEWDALAVAFVLGGAEAVAEMGPDVAALEAMARGGSLLEPRATLAAEVLFALWDLPEPEFDP